MEKFLVFLVGFLTVLAVSALGAAIFMGLWNWVVVAIFGLPKLSFWLAWGLSFLLGMVFGARGK